MTENKSVSVKNILNNIGIYEIAVFSATIIFELFILLYYKNSWLGAAVAVTGVTASLLNAGMKRTTFIFGAINCITYAAVSFRSGFYGTAVMSAFVYLPLQISGYFTWRRHLTGNRVNVRKMGTGRFLIWFSLLSVSSVASGFLLRTIGTQTLPFTDAISSIFSFAAALFVVLRYREQWPLYILTNVLLLVMWSLQIDLSDGEVLSVIFLRFIYLTNSIYGFIRWYKASKANIKDSNEIKE